MSASLPPVLPLPARLNEMRLDDTCTRFIFHCGPFGAIIYLVVDVHRDDSWTAFTIDSRANPHPWRDDDYMRDHIGALKYRVMPARIYTMVISRHATTYVTMPMDCPARPKIHGLRLELRVNNENMAHGQRALYTQVWYGLRQPAPFIEDAIPGMLALCGCVEEELVAQECTINAHGA